MLHTPGHSPGACCFHAPALGALFTGDTLFHGGPARPGGRSPTSRPSSSRSAPGCSTLPADTVVHTGHGDDTTIGAEAPHLEEWIARGH